MSTVLIILLPHAVLAAAACLLLLAGRFSLPQRWWGAASLLAIAAGAAALPLATPSAATEFASIHQNAFSEKFQWVAFGLALLIGLAGIGPQHKRETAPEQFALFLLALTGVLLVPVANDLIVMFLALELVALPTSLLLYVDAAPRQQEALQKHFVLGILAAGLFLYGAAFLYGVTGTTNLAASRHILAASYAPGDSSLAVGQASRLGVIALVLITASLGFRMALVPFHFAEPDLYQAANPWSAMLLAVGQKAAGFAAAFQVLVGTMAGYENAGQLLAIVLATITMALGNGMALAQSRIRTRLAYSTIAYGGFLMVGLAVGFAESAQPEQSLDFGPSLPGGAAAAFFCLGTYALAVVGLFSVLGYLARRGRQLEYLDDLKGLLRSEPLAAVLMSGFLLSLVGLPPFAGFWGRLFVLAAALNIRMESTLTQLLIPHRGFVALVVIAALHIVLTAADHLRVVSTMLLDDPISRPRPEGGQANLAVALIAGLLLLGVGLLPGPVLELWGR